MPKALTYIYLITIISGKSRIHFSIVSKHSEGELLYNVLLSVSIYIEIDVTSFAIFFEQIIQAILFHWEMERILLGRVVPWEYSSCEQTLLFECFKQPAFHNCCEK